MKSGKRFEYNFKKSIPKDVYHYRLPDGTASWQEGTNTRFQQKNPCDYFIHHKGFLFLLELKSYKGKSIPFNSIRDNQLKELYNISQINGEQYPFIVFNYQDKEETYMVHITDIMDYIEECKRNDGRKSFAYDWVTEVGYYIPSYKKITNYRYDILTALNNVINNIPC